MAIDNERVQQLANSLTAATRAYEKGLRINDSMTIEQARLLHLGRLFAEAIANGKPRNPKVIEAGGYFHGDKS